MAEYCLQQAMTGLRLTLLNALRICGCYLSRQYASVETYPVVYNLQLQSFFL